jgi:mannose-1-phosphate guanylyltransferase
MKPPEALVLAAGKGSRLFPLTNNDRGISRKSLRDFTRIHRRFIAAYYCLTRGPKKAATLICVRMEAIERSRVVSG